MPFSRWLQTIEQHVANLRSHVPRRARTVADAPLKERAEAEAREQSDDDQRCAGRIADNGGEPRLG